MTLAQVAQKVGKERTTVANAVRLLKLPEAVQDMVQSGLLSMGQARALLGLKVKANIEELAQTVVSRQLTVRQVEVLVKQINEGPVEKQPATPTSPYIRALATQLEEKFGTKVKVNATEKGSGKIEINYLSNDDLSRILALLNVEVD